MRKLENALGRGTGLASAPENCAGVVCVSVREGAPALMVVALGGRTWVLPWVHFQYAWFENEGEEEAIKLFFSSHEVSLEGLRLKRLVEHFAKFGVEWVRGYDKRYQNLCPQDQAFVMRIEVREKSD